MSDVQFEEEDILISEASKINQGAKGLIKLTMRFGAKDENQASYILIGVMVLCLIATMYVISTYILN